MPLLRQCRIFGLLITRNPTQPAMTREEIEALPAGDLANQLVAEVVFGIKNVRAAWRVDYPGYWSTYELDEKPEDDDATLCRIYDDVKAKDADVLPNYTVSIYHAYSVLDQFPDSEWEVHLVRWGNDSRGWMASLESFGASSGQVFAPTLPLAICRAALLTKISNGEV